MKEKTLAIIDGLLVGDPQTFLNMVVFPLIGKPDGELEYVTLEEALESNYLEITEISEGGSVPELDVKNNSNSKILLLDGEELVGAKQNRILNTTILIDEKSSTKIPVSCVEKGRWSYRSKSFSSSGSLYYSSGRAEKSREVSESYKGSRMARANQGRIWRDIDRKSVSLGSVSATGAMSESYAKYREKISEYQNAFHPQNAQVGEVVIINGRIFGVDIFGKHDILKKLQSKLLTSYALDAIELEGEKVLQFSNKQARDFLSKLKEADFEGHKSVGIGTDIRINSKDLQGYALMTENHLIHMALFPQSPDV